MRSVNSAEECARLAKGDKSFILSSECKLGRGLESRKRQPGRLGDKRYQIKGSSVGVNDGREREQLSSRMTGGHERHS